MATRWKIREKLGSVFYFVLVLYIAALFVNGWIIEPLFSKPAEPKQCGPHHHFRPTGEHREFDQMITDYSCVEDVEWACRKASSHLTDNELAALKCAPAH